MTFKTVSSYSVSLSPGGYLVRRDDLPLRTPAGMDLILPTALLAETVAEEWRQQKDKIVPTTMPMTQLTMTTLDITTKNSASVVDHLLGYIDTELLCHRVDLPGALALRQNSLWQPLLDWCAAKFGAELATGTGIMPVRQKPETGAALQHALTRYDHWALTGLNYAVDCSSSLVLGLALAEQYLSVQQVMEAAELDSCFQMEKWGADPDILQRQNQIREDLETAARWFTLLAKP